jgi:formylglycine-generating enzyme required for sulfatase activity
MGPLHGTLVRNTLVSARLHSLSHEVIDAEATMRRFPGFCLPEHYVSVIQPDGGFIAAEAALLAHMDLSIAAGASVRTGERVLKVTQQAGSVRVVTDRGIIETGAVIIAAGSWTMPRSNFKEFVVPHGMFMMGSPDGEKDSLGSEIPQHKVTIAKPFAIGKTEVTFAEWGTCVAAGACHNAYEDIDMSRGGDWPVILVSWDDAKQYVAWLSRITCNQYRLLTEAEWEYAARAGSQERYSLGDDEAQLDQYAWYQVNSNRWTQQVGVKAANAFGLHDMHGYVEEWIEDPWHDDYVGAPADGSSWVEADDANRRVVRGGSWGSNLICMSSDRPLYVADCSANKHILLSSEENGEPLSSLRLRAREPRTRRHRPA